MIGSFERNVNGRFIYKTSDEYSIFKAQGMKLIKKMPRSFNIWQNIGQLEIWFLAHGI